MPVLIAVVYLLTRPDTMPVGKAVLIYIGASLLGAALSIWAIFSLLEPVRMTSRYLRDFVDDGRRGELPTNYGDQVGQLMQNAQRTVEQLDGMIHELEQRTITDALTGVHNRRFCTARLAQDLSRSGRSGDPLTIAFMDIDYFKEVNDQYGHGAGDTCLKHVVNATRTCIREGDWIARWGGDEFLIVMWGADAGQASEVCDRVREALAQNPCVIPQGEIQLQVSIGVCKADPKQSADELFQRVDTALLAAKRSGRNRVAVR